LDALDFKAVSLSIIIGDGARGLDIEL